MDVRLPDGTIIEGVPDGTTKAQLAERLRRNGVDVPDDWMRPTGRSAAYEEGRREAPGALQGLISGLQGPTFGFADEILGGLGAVGKTLVGGNLADNYREMRDFYRGASDSQEEQFPVMSRVTRAAASAPTMFIGGGAAPGAGMVRNAMQAAKVGGITGAVSGLGGSEAESLGGMALDAAQGGALGAGLGAAAVPLSRAAGGVYNAAASRFSDSVAGRYAKEKLAEAMARDARGAVMQSSPIEALSQASARMRTLGPEARVVDAGGQNTRQLLDTLATLPGQTKNATEAAILSRQAGRAGRLREAAEAGLNPSGLRLTETIDDLIARRSEAAKPLYDNLYKQGMFVNDELAEIIDAANKLGAGSAGKRIATANMRPYSLEGKVAWAPMRELDYLKQGLDDIIEANKNDSGKLTKVGAAVNGLKQDLVSLLDQQTKGAYKAAREAYAGPSALIDAAKGGGRAWSMSDADITKAMQSMTQGEQEAFKLGAADALRAKLGNQAGQTEVMKMWRDKTTGEKLRAIFGDERAFRSFAAKAAAESRLKGIESVGRGSQTAARQYGAGDLDVPAVADAMQSLSNPSPLNLLSSASRAWNKVQTPEPVRDAMGRMLLEQGRAGRSTIGSLDEAMRAVYAKRARDAGLLGIGSGAAAGGLLGMLP